MEMTGEQVIARPQLLVWQAITDPQVLKTCIPGCEAMEQIGENEYQVVMGAKVGPVSAKFKGRITLAEVQAPDSYTLVFEGQGGVAGFAKGQARVRLVPEGETTRLHYDAKATIGGKLAQVGSRLVDGVARKMADAFFTAFNRHVSGS